MNNENVYILEPEEDIRPSEEPANYYFVLHIDTVFEVFAKIRDFIIEKLNPNCIKTAMPIKKDEFCTALKFFLLPTLQIC